ncbi:MAG: hypothetical protein ACFFD4_21025 [Candidatus Odinarchaeota archaeon]
MKSDREGSSNRGSFYRSENNSLDILDIPLRPVEGPRRSWRGHGEVYFFLNLDRETTFTGKDFNIPAP